MANDIVAIQVQEIDGQLLVDSRLIAEQLGIQHETVIKHLKKYSMQFQALGHLRFEIGTVTNSVGAVNSFNFAFLNEAQATFLMTLSKNTDLVVQCKLALVCAFEKARSQQEFIALPSSPSKELVAAREIREITDLLDDNPRLAQCLTDSIANRVLERNLLPGTATQLRGVAEIAVEMGFKVDASSRVKLGKFIVARGFDPVKESRLCNGVMTAINCYEDTPVLREAIADYFEH